MISSHFQHIRAVITCKVCNHLYSFYLVYRYNYIDTSEASFLWNKYYSFIYSQSQSIYQSPGVHTPLLPVYYIYVCLKSDSLNTVIPVLKSKQTYSVKMIYYCRMKWVTILETQKPNILLGNSLILCRFKMWI